MFGGNAMNRISSENKILPICLIFVMTLFQACAGAMIKYGMILYKADSGGKEYIIFFSVAMFIYCAAFPLYTYILSKLKLCVAQPVISGSVFLYTMLISLLFFRESFALYKIFGFAAIIGGIIIVVI